MILTKYLRLFLLRLNPSQFQVKQVTATLFEPSVRATEASTTWVELSGDGSLNADFLQRLLAKILQLMLWTYHLQ